MTKVVTPWVKVFRIIPEFRFLRLTFHRKSTSKYRIKQIIRASLINFKYIILTIYHLNLKLLIFCRHTGSFFKI